MIALGVRIPSLDLLHMHRGPQKQELLRQLPYTILVSIPKMCPAAQAATRQRRTAFYVLRTDSSILAEGATQVSL